VDRERDEIFRIIIADREDGTSRGIPVRSLLGDPPSAGSKAFKGCAAGGVAASPLTATLPSWRQMYLKTNQFHMEQFVCLVERLKQIDEAGQSLLDSSILMFASNL
jgi:hypothetical protein